METAILSPLITEYIPGSDGQFVRLKAPFVFQSQKLHSMGLEAVRHAPVEFVCDLESIPWFRGSSPESGVIHDLVCRTDFDSRVSKKVAADIYMEFLGYTYSLDNRDGASGIFEKAWDSTIEHGKYGVVLVWPGYFHKHPVMATYKEMSA